jgi:hypothetical protein
VIRRVVSTDYVGVQAQFKHCKDSPYLSQAENRDSVSWGCTTYAIHNTELSTSNMQWCLTRIVLVCARL